MEEDDGASPHRKLNDFLYLTVNFACNFANKRSKYAEVSQPATLTDAAVVMHPIILCVAAEEGPCKAQMLKTFFTFSKLLLRFYTF